MALWTVTQETSAREICIRKDGTLEKTYIVPMESSLLLDHEIAVLTVKHVADNMQDGDVLVLTYQKG